MSRPTRRGAWFQVHKWLGLVVAVLVIPISLTGAALVWHDALDRAVNPGRFATTGAALLPADAYLAAARAVLKPGDRIAQITMAEHGGPVAIAAAPASRPHAPADPARGGPQPRVMVYLDPPTARVLDVASSRSGLVRFLHALHGSLRISGGWGRTIVGWVGVVMMVSAATGLWLWWPTTGTWVRALRWRRHRHVDTSLHHLLGFWTALPLFVLSLTGAWISFPAFFETPMGEARGPERGSGRPDRAAAARALPLRTPARTVAQVIATARPMSRGATLHSIVWPTDLSPDWTVGYVGKGARAIKVADDTGWPTAAAARRPVGTARLMRRVHGGDGMGVVWQTVVFLSGVLPAVLAVTGVMMWWRVGGRRTCADGVRPGREAA